MNKTKKLKTLKSFSIENDIIFNILFSNLYKICSYHFSQLTKKVIYKVLHHNETRILI